MNQPSVEIHAGNFQCGLWIALTAQISAKSISCDSHNQTRLECLAALHNSLWIAFEASDANFLPRHFQGVWPFKGQAYQYIRKQKKFKYQIACGLGSVLRIQ